MTTGMERMAVFVRTGALATLCLGAIGAMDRLAASEQDAHAHHDHHAMHHGNEGAASEDPHARHRAMLTSQGYQRSEHDYAVVDIPVVDMQGNRSSLTAELDHDKPVMMSFIFTSCTTICPVLSATFAKVQEVLGPEAQDVRMVSISIDPEYDTPSRLKAYARLYSAGEQWQFLTGSLDDMIAVQRVFDVYRGNKMNHEPTILLRMAKDEPWVRLDGLVSASELTREYRSLAAAR